MSSIHGSPVPASAGSREQRGGSLVVAMPSGSPRPVQRSPASPQYRQAGAVLLGKEQELTHLTWQASKLRGGSTLTSPAKNSPTMADSPVQFSTPQLGSPVISSPKASLDLDGSPLTGTARARTFASETVGSFISQGCWGSTEFLCEPIARAGCRGNGELLCEPVARTGICISSPAPYAWPATARCAMAPLAKLLTAPKPVSDGASSSSCAGSCGPDASPLVSHRSQRSQRDDRVPVAQKLEQLVSMREEIMEQIQSTANSEEIPSCDRYSHIARLRGELEKCLADSTAEIEALAAREAEETYAEDKETTAREEGHVTSPARGEKALVLVAEKEEFVLYQRASSNCLTGSPSLGAGGSPGRVYAMAARGTAATSSGWLRASRLPQASTMHTGLSTALSMPSAVPARLVQRCFVLRQ